MAPHKQRDPSIERTDEYEDFMKKLHEYHEKRGTHLDAEPKVGPRHVDLFKLYKRVTEEGGYDKVSDTKGNKLAWRRIATEFLPGSANVVQLAFLVKTAYYKNLAAYEISTFHKREPPPKEILEDVSAKGGDLLNRTLENYHPRISREAERLANGDDASSDEERKTPSHEKMEVDEANSASGRLTRSLRQAPPQRVLFGTEQSAPSTSSSGRQIRSTTHANSPTPAAAGVNGTYGAHSAAAAIASYEPRVNAASIVKPVTTPANNAEHFRALARRLLQNRRLAKGIPQPRGMMAPGTGFSGPSIYNRTLLSLQSGVPEEVQYALHHLVKISHERGDKYRFDQFVGLAEALIEKVLEVSILFYGFKWRISYNNEDCSEVDVLNGTRGTMNLLSKIKAHQPLDIRDELQTDNFTQLIGNINEAGLVLRNMVMLDENAHYLVKTPLIRDLIAIVINLPKRTCIGELQHYVLEIAEQLTKFFLLSSDDPLYLSLVAQLDSNDRNCVITTLRAISRIAMHLEARNRLPDIPTHALRRICDWLLVDDEELRNACLDFLYQYSGEADNVRIMLRSCNVEALVAQLSRSLMHGAVLSETREKSKSTVTKTKGAEAPPKLSKSIVDQLCTSGDSRELSSQWLLSCFEADPEGEITQLTLWQAYNECFNNADMKQNLMQAKDFIQNVSNTFPNAQAQVVQNEADPKRPRYTIRGIRPRAVPVDSRGRPYMRCLWQTPVIRSVEDTNSGPANGTRQPNYAECDLSVAKPEEMWEHVITAHLGLCKDPATGKYTAGRGAVVSHSPQRSVTADDAMDVDGGDDPSRTWSCHWAGCRHFPEPIPSAVRVAKHIMTHLPDSSIGAALRRQNNRTVETKEDLKAQLHRPLNLDRKFWNTLIDERNDAAGLPLAAVLVLRNLARQMAKIDEADQSAMEFATGGVGDYLGADEGPRREGWIEKCFAPVRDRIFFAMAHNLSLKEYLAPLLEIVDASMGL